MQNETVDLNNVMLNMEADGNNINPELFIFQKENGGKLGEDRSHNISI